MTTSTHSRWFGLAGMAGALALLGGCVATGPVGYDDYPYGYGGSPAQVDIDVYGHPGYQTYPGGYPYYDQRRAYDPRWNRGYRRGQPPRTVVPVPVPVPVPTRPGVRPPHGGWQHQPGVRPPTVRPLPPQARPGQPPARVIQGARIPGLPSGVAIENRPIPPGDQP